MSTNPTWWTDYVKNIGAINSLKDVSDSEPMTTEQLKALAVLWEAQKTLDPMYKPLPECIVVATEEENK
jgi:hypothetical protein